MKKFTIFLTIFMLTAGLTACSGTKNGTDSSNTGVSQTTQNTSDIQNQVNNLFNEENVIFNNHKELWDKVMGLLGKSVADENINYADYLWNAIDSAKDQFTQEELDTLKSDVDRIRDIENQISSLESQLGSDNENGSTVSTSDIKTFPQFTGKDFDGNNVDSSIFSNNAVTLVNFWFNGCSPCVAELPTLSKLNETLKEKGGAVIGINVEALDNNQNIIQEAKSIMEKQGAVYQNIYFDSNSDAGKYAGSIMAFPTSILVDRNGNIVGEQIVGGLDNQEVFDSVQQQIDEIVAKDQAELSK